MAEEFPAIASPLHLGPEGRGATLKNRIVVSPTTFGLPHDAYVRRIAGIARGGCAMVVIGDVPVRRHERASLFSRKGAAEYRDLVEAIHAGGALAAAQLHESDSDFKALIPYVPGVLMKKISMMELRHILNEKAKELVTNMPVRKVRAITAAFGPAAVRARELGFDVMQIHGDRMVGSFSSALMSSREDEYGGSPERRTRFAVEAVRAVREAVPEMAIDYKLAVRQEDPRYGQAGVLLRSCRSSCRCWRRQASPASRWRLPTMAASRTPSLPASIPTLAARAASCAMRTRFASSRSCQSRAWARSVRPRLWRSRSRAGASTSRS